MKHEAHYLSNLTPLRGVAALLVAVFHFETTIAYFITPQESMLIEKSYLMVDLFFIMSGFIMVHVYCDFFNSQLTTQAFRKFILARFARIYPLHLFVLLLMVAMMGIARLGGAPSNSVMDFAAIPTHLLLLQSFGIHSIYTWNIPSWSISAEWWCYVIFPLLVAFISKRKNLAVVTLGCFVILAYLSILFWLPRIEPFTGKPMPHNLDTTYDFGFLRGLAGFITGMLVYQFYGVQGIRKIFGRDGVALLVIIALLACLHIGINDGLYPFLFAALVLCLSCNGDIFYRICNFKILQYIGKISYSIYMIQVFLLIPFFMGAKLSGEVVSNGLDGRNTVAFSTGLLDCILFLLLLIGLSSITYYTIEQPMRKRINKKFGKQTINIENKGQPPLQAVL